MARNPGITLRFDWSWNNSIWCPPLRIISLKAVSGSGKSWPCIQFVEKWTWKQVHFHAPNSFDLKSKYYIKTNIKLRVSRICLYVTPMMSLECNWIKTKENPFQTLRYKVLLGIFFVLPGIPHPKSTVPLSDRHAFNSKITGCLRSVLRPIARRRKSQVTSNCILVGHISLL